VPRYSEEDARRAVAESFNYTETLRALGLRPAGGNFKVLRRWVDEVWGIPTDHFDQDRALRRRLKAGIRPLDEVLVEHSNYGRTRLKRRLYDAGLKQRACEICGQGEIWRNRFMGLILDHVNGVADDNRIENLRIVCPNCNSTLDTHCGRRNQMPSVPRECQHCGESFTAKFPTQRFCSRVCGRRSRGPRGPHPERRKVQRPPYEQLMAELAATNYCAVARRYGVSDNAVRKWVRWYEADAERRGEGGEDATG
jgi:transposase-like protein